MTRRRRKSDELVTIYWRDIPAQITASGDGQTEKLLLTQRFQDAIDRSASVAGLTDAHSYVAQWRRVTRPLEGSADSAARAEAEQLEASYPRQRLQHLVRQGGLEASPEEDPEGAGQ